MSAITLERGKVYRVQYSGGFTEAQFIGEVERGGNGFLTRSLRRHYIFQNLKTGRDIEIKSMIQIKREVK